MNNFISAILIYGITFLYFLLSNRAQYIYTLNFYSLFKYISNDKNCIKILVNNMIIYKTIIRYIRIHLIFSSILITISYYLEMSLIVVIIKPSVIFVVIITILDILSFRSRLAALEDKLYKTYYRIYD